MEQFIIVGPTRLSGAVCVSGSKNAALPIIAASILVSGKTILKNIPKINDVLSLISILEKMGVCFAWEGNTLTIDSRRWVTKDPDPEQVRKLRASILLVAPVLIKNKNVSIPHPGGCLIGARPIDVHVRALAKMGASYSESRGKYTLKAKELRGQDTCADFSVTATENIIMAATLAKGTTKISLAAAEPHVQDLCHFLNKAGARISGIGTHNLVVVGVGSLKPIEYQIAPDQTEAGTFAIAAAASKGKIEIDGFRASDQESLLSKFDAAGVRYKIISPEKIQILPSENLKSFKIRTEVYPGFPTDLQAPMAVLATQCQGTTEIYETIFEGRLGYVNELSKMGAAAIIRDAHQASITGPTPLSGTRITSFDLRAGATLIVAAICAKGESRLDQIEIIDRGYEGIEQKFRQLGAKIKRIKLKEIEQKR